MNREAFESQYADDWGRLGKLLDRLEASGSRRQEPVRAGEFPELYRRVCHHLALARVRRYGTDLEQRLNRLVLRGHHQLYRGRAISWSRIGEFFAAEFPRRVRAEGRLFQLCLVLFFAPLFAMMFFTSQQPELIYALMDPAAVEEFEEMYDPQTDRDRGAASDVLMFGVYIYNNIGIAFRTFAGGILFGIGSIFILIYNGLAIGSVLGYVDGLGHGTTLYPFIVGHGAFELTAIVLAGASGLKLGLSVVAPGRRRRIRALVAAGRDSIRLVYGIVGLLVVAAFLEAFWSSATLVPPEVKYLFGALAWSSVAAYFLLAGRDRGA